MATDVEQLIVSLNAEFSKFRNEMRKASGVFDREGRKIERRQQDIERRLSRFGSNLGRTLIPSLGAIGAALSTREIIRYADAWTAAGNRIAAMGTPMDQQATRLRELADIAVDTRNAFETTVSTYSRLQLATENLGKSEADLLRITETINKAFVVGGAGTSERQAAALQLSQAIASGILGGDELRSIRENAPIIARAIADVMGTTVGGLKELGAQGKITADKIIEALERLAPTVDEQFKQTNLTVSDAMTNLRTRFTELVGQLSESGATGALAGGIDLLAKNLGNVANALGIATALLAPAGLAASARAAGAAVGALWVLIASNPIGAVLSVLSAAAAALYLYSDSLNFATEAEEKHANALGEVEDALNAARDAGEKLGEVEADRARATLEAARADLVSAKALREKQLAAIETRRALMDAHPRGNVGGGLDPFGFDFAPLGFLDDPSAKAAELRNLNAALEENAEAIARIGRAEQGVFDPIPAPPTSTGGGTTGADSGGSARLEALAERRAALLQQTARELADAQSEFADASTSARLEMLRGTQAYFDAARDATLELSTLEIQEINERERAQMLALERVHEERIRQGSDEVSTWAEYEDAKTNIEQAAALRRRAIRTDAAAEIARINIEERLQAMQFSNEVIESEEELARTVEEVRLRMLQGTEEYYDALREFVDNETQREIDAIWRAAEEDMAALDERLLGHEAYQDRLRQIRARAENEETAAIERNRGEHSDIDEELNRTKQNSIIIMDSLRGGLEDIGIAALKGADSFKEAVGRMLQDIGILIFKLLVLRPLIEAILGPAGTFGGGGLGRLFAGGFASGGMIPRGQFGVVGENGPELAVSGSSGTRIIPGPSSMKSMSGGNAVVTINQSFPLNGAMGDEGVRRIAQEQASAAAVGAFDAVRRALPGMMIEEHKRRL